MRNVLRPALKYAILRSADAVGIGQFMEVTSDAL
jgi:hypothetical protein